MYLEVSRRITKAKVNFKYIAKHARNSWTVTFETSVLVNKVTKNETLKSIGFISYISRFKLLRKGIIKGVPVDVTNKELTHALKKDIIENKGIVINKIFRLKRKKPSTAKWIDLQSVCIEFKESITRYQDMESKNFSLDLHPLDKEVLRCGCIRHISKGCKAHQRCLICSEDYHIEKDKDKYCTKEKSALIIQGNIQLWIELVQSF